MSGGNRERTRKAKINELWRCVHPSGRRFAAPQDEDFVRCDNYGPYPEERAYWRASRRMAGAAMTDQFTCAIEPGLSADEFIDVLKRSTLAERRPVNERARIEKMLKNADLIVTARDENGRLIGVSRCVTDFSFCCYCSDLAVDTAQQGKGVGRRLIKESAKAAGDHAHFILLSAPGAVSYYEHIGMRRLDVAFDWPNWKRFSDDKAP